MSREEKLNGLVMRYYLYTVDGIGSNDNTWKITGNLVIAPAQFPDIFDMIMEDVFNQLTRGKAVYGKPGVGCAGPYTVNRILLEREEKLQ